MSLLQSKQDLLGILKDLDKKFQLSKVVDDAYYDPGMMENLDQYWGEYNEERNSVVLRVESKGLRYDNRTPRLDGLTLNDEVQIVRDHLNKFNMNNFEILNKKNESLGYLPAELCNALAPLYDNGYASISSSKVSYIERISERSRYAKQGILFVELRIQLRGI